MAAATLTDPGDQSAPGSSAVRWLVVIALGLGLGYAGFRLWRRRQQRKLEALWEQDREGMIRQIERERALRASNPKQAVRASNPKQAVRASKPSAARLEKIDIG